MLHRAYHSSLCGVETLDVTSVTGGTTTVSMIKSGYSFDHRWSVKDSADAAYAGKLAFVGDSGAKTSM